MNEIMDKSNHNNNEINNSLIGEKIENNVNITIDNYIEEHRNIENIIKDSTTNNDEKLNKIIEIAKNIRYPEYYSNYKGKNYYYDKYIYLLTAKLFNYYRLYPDYIEYEEDNNIKKNKKRIFRNSISNYELDDNYYLCYKHTNNDSKETLSERRGNNRHIRKIEGEYELYKIPTVKNVIKIIDDIHTSLIHLGKNKILDKIKELKIFYHWIYYDIENIINLCHICIQKNIQFYKRQLSKQILMSAPLERIVVDLTYLPEFLLTNTNYKYLLNIADHFSKYVTSYLIKKKDGKSISE